MRIIQVLAGLNTTDITIYLLKTSTEQEYPESITEHIDIIILYYMKDSPADRIRWKNNFG